MLDFLTNPNTITLITTVAVIILLIATIRIPSGPLRTKIWAIILKLLDRIKPQK